MSKRPLTAKQEAFAQAVAQGHTLSDAYRLCYEVKTQKDESVWRMAVAVADNVKVSSRIEELKQPQVYQNRASREWILNEAANTYEATDNAAHKIQSLRLIADLQGYIIRKAEVKSESTTIEMSLGDARQLLALKAMIDSGEVSTERLALMFERVRELPEHDKPTLTQGD